MANNFRTIYLYIVAMITLGMIVGGIVSTANNIASYFYPDSSVFFEEEKNSYDKYDYGYDYNYNNEIDNARRNAIEKGNYKNEKIKNTIVSVAVIGVGAIMYKYHWKIIEKERVK